ncbi:Gfo/Idh/MocA family protein [Roseiconus lacunae]|uniref:Gfo/Idh/MocA family protein n=1 Tax=Roseiconus lacunae TaxID=2605694 RepID=UPI0011F2D233|nr:Gfo/Idh/MocA family oxidoreductase [Roseiconus lacunae]MCD0461491.1 Gfo/Idh/MocA family oxidoreductase [Roseiconus lacunae]WRQ51166.1 Gfo/Idh/MocA family oxidoreductase [Stieleria sp. HD01]
MSTTRRQFIKTTAAASAMATTGIASVGALQAQENSKKLRLAAIGVGGSRGRYNRGGSIARGAAKFADMIAVCDVDDLHTEEFNQAFGGKLNKYRDYREMLQKEKPQVVTIGTPDHWHVPIAIEALRSGADVYCEKPLTLTIDEGKQIRKVVEETGRVFQVGTQQRSTKSLFLTAIAMVHTGHLGNNVNAYVAIGGAPGDGPFETTEAPDDLDWNLWLGPAQEAGYCEERRRMFRWYFDYSGGKMTDWGAHHIDIAQWALAPGETGPTRVKGSGEFPKIVPSNFDWPSYLDGELSLPNGYNTATKFSIDLSFDNGSTINVNDRYKREGDNVDFPNGILFEGDKGRIFVNRGKLEGGPVNRLTDADKKELDAYITKLCKGKKPGDHMGNFFECIGDRSKPISDVWSHQRTMTSCHLCNIALMTGRELKWDPKREVFIDDEDANRYLSRKSRQFDTVS